MLTPEQRVEQLIKQGATIQVTVAPDAPDVLLTLAGVVWLTSPTRLRWCAIFPEHQGHIHELNYTRAVLDNDGRDVLFYSGDELVAAIVPCEETGSDISPIKAALAAWRAQLAEYGNAVRFAEFLANT